MDTGAAWNARVSTRTQSPAQLDFQGWLREIAWVCSGEWTDNCDARALQDPLLWSRFTRAEAWKLWECMQHIDAAMREPEPEPELEPEPTEAPQVDELRWEPGFQGGPTEYTFHSCPAATEFQPGGRLEPVWGAEARL